jgi:RHS repeat-associated protein
VTLPDGTIRTQAFNAVGEVISSTDALGRETRYEYDAKGNLAAVVDPLGGTTRYAYDAEDNLVRQTDANGNVTRFVYDENGRMTQRIYPDGSTESQTYDAAGRVATMTGPDGGVTTLEYDAVGRVLRKTFPDASTESFTYSPSGRMLTATNSAGTVVFEYDDLDRLRRLENVDGSVITYTYDAAGNRISESVRLAGSVVATVTSYAYDAMNRLSSITDADGGVTSLTYDAIGNMVSRTLPNGVRTEYSFDPNSRLTRLTHGSAPLMLADYVYDLNAVGDRVRVTETVSGESAEYAYDPLRRLVSESYFDDRSVKVFELSYEYDAVGNRTALTDSAGTRTTYRYDNADKLLSQGAINYEYDASGNLRVARSPSAAARFTFDQEDQLIRVLRDGRETGYTYDARGERIRRASGGTTTNYLVDPVSLTGYSQVLADYTIAGGETRYTFGLERVSRDDGVPQYFHADASRNVRLLTDSTGTVTDRYDYQAFGQLRRASGASPNLYGFAGEHFDPEADLTYLRARYYDPVLGRFVSRDPFAGMPDEPMSLHRYLYAYANPLLFTDPSGEAVVTATGLAIASAIAGTIAGVVMAANSLYQAYGATAGFTDDRRARTDEFRVRFCSGATVAAGLGGGALTASIAEIGTKNPESSTYNLSVFGVGGAIGAATGGGEVRFDTPTPKNVKSFAGLGEIRTIGAGVGGIAGAAYDLYRIPNAGTEWVENVTKPGIGDSVSGLGLGAGGIVGWAYWSPRSLNDAIDKYTFRLNCPVAID